MSSAADSVVRILRGAREQGRPLLMLFDFDGTLAPIVDQPDRAALQAKTRRALRALSGFRAVRVGVLSSRSLDDLRPRIGLDGVDLSGSSGLEWEIEGRSRMHPAALFAAPLLDRAARELAPVVERHPGAWIERKTCSFAVHYRALTRGRVSGFERRVRRILGAREDRLKVVRACAAFEVVPRLEWGKGSVVRLIHAGMPRGSELLYAGDSDGDREAMESVLELGGVTVGVGRDAPSSCRHRLRDPSALARMLDALLRQLRSGRRWR